MAREVRVPREEHTSSKAEALGENYIQRGSTKIMAREVPTPCNQDQGRLLYSAPNGNCSRVSILYTFRLPLHRVAGRVLLC